MNKFIKYTLMVVLLGITIIAGWLIINIIPENERFLINVLTTSVGLIVGIPVALAINDNQRMNQEDENTLKQEKQNSDKQNQYLQLIYNEICLNKAIIEASIEGQKTVPNFSTHLGIKSELWKSILSSGDVKYISDPLLLDSISTSYYYTNRIKELEKVYFHPNFYMAISSKKVKSFTGKRSVDAIEVLRPEALNEVNESIAQITEHFDTNGHTIA